MVFILHQRSFLYGRRENAHTLQILDSLHFRSVQAEKLALFRFDAELRVELREHLFYHVAEAVHHGQHADKRSRRYHHSGSTHARNDVNGIMTLLREQIPPRDDSFYPHLKLETFVPLNLLLQQLINRFHLVKRRVDVEVKLRNDAQLVVLQIPQLKTDGLRVFLHLL